jgi:hypothetical protein
MTNRLFTCGSGNKTACDELFFAIVLHARNVLGREHAPEHLPFAPKSNTLRYNKCDSAKAPPSSRTRMHGELASRGRFRKERDDQACVVPAISVLPRLICNTPLPRWQ